MWNEFGSQPLTSIDVWIPEVPSTNYVKLIQIGYNPTPLALAHLLSGALNQEVNVPDGLCTYIGHIPESRIVTVELDMGARENKKLLPKLFEIFGNKIEMFEFDGVASSLELKKLKVNDSCYVVDCSIWQESKHFYASLMADLGCLDDIPLDTLFAKLIESEFADPTIIPVILEEKALGVYLSALFKIPEDKIPQSLLNYQILDSFCQSLGPSTIRYYPE